MTDRLFPRPGDVVARSDFTDPVEIVERMARDILAARRIGDDRMPTFLLIDLGWPWSQVVRFGADAGDLALTPTFVAHDVIDRMQAAEDAAEVAVTIALADPRTGDMTTMIDDLDHAGDAA